MRQKCWQPIETPWQMQQNVCWNQDNDDISSALAGWSAYRIVSACSWALLNGWAIQETASTRVCTIVDACLRWYSIDYQVKLKFHINFFDYLVLFYLFCLFVCVLCSGTCYLYWFAFSRFGLPALLHGTFFPWGKIKEIKVNKTFWHYFLLWNFACWFDLFLICVLLASCGCDVAKVVCLYGLWKWVWQPPTALHLTE